ncbi:uncharacterized protein METZ01_LOCUS292973, partial [marine metagenome]
IEWRTIRCGRTMNLNLYLCLNWKILLNL